MLSHAASVKLGRILTALAEFIDVLCDDQSIAGRISFR